LLSMPACRTRFISGAAAGLLFAATLRGQDGPVTRQAVIDAALARGARFAAATADTLTGAAQVALARQWQNPTFSASYSKDVPQRHYSIDIPLDLPYVRGPRIGAATMAQRAMRARFVYERASVAMEADTAYTRALAARALAELSARSAQDADSLRRMAVARRDAGDASDMDVALATITAGQAANDALTDSLTYASALLDLQVVMGMTDRAVRIALADSLAMPPAAPSGSGGRPLAVAAAADQVESASLALRAERRNVLGQPSIVAGWDAGDPSGADTGRLPMFGVALPIPLFNRNSAAISLAQAEAARARAELSLMTVLSRTERERAEREYAAASARLVRDGQLVKQAELVAAMSMTADREGAAALPAVLEARRAAREVLAQRVRDAADVWVAAAELKVLTLTAPPSVP
jgi:cobalt-zinc-cadmium efflux system outer membrane protein